MLKTRTMIIACLLLLVPTLLLGLGALQLLRQQEQTLQQRGQATASDRALAIAGNIDLAVGEVLDGLQQTLQQLPQTGQTEALESWKRSNPLVRNVFIWQSGRGLLHPDPAQPTSAEEGDFIRRYQSLFSSQTSWRPPQADQPQSTPLAASSDLYQERQKLRDLATEAPAAAVSEMAAAPAPDTGRGESGWRPWFADNRLHLLGWYQSTATGQRIGLELEMMALLGRLLSNLPPAPPAGESYQLIDGNGEVFHQTGGLLKNDLGSLELARVELSSLPHWQVRIIADAHLTAAGQSSFLLITSLLVGSFVVCILAGGGLLLWQAWQKAREARQKTSFVSNVSHELKTPLTSIRMYAEMINEQHNLDERTDRYLQVIVKESERLTRLVNNVLDFSRLEQGRRSYRQQRLDLVELLQQLLDQQLPRINDAGLKLLRTLPETPAAIISDRDALEQIILNLLDNAIKYAAAGKELQVELQRVEKNWRLCIRDQGPGIKQEHLQKIFDKFHRIDDRLSAPVQGTGLGLSIARQLAEGLGGTLECHNNKSSGASFILNLPAGAAE